MKRILITGKDSYIGTNFVNYVASFPDKYTVDELDVRGDKWESFDFSPYDVVLHVAAIVHIEETPENHDLYFKVNRDLAIKVADKAHQSGVTQFILLSTMSVYPQGLNVIDVSSKPCPYNAYGESKLEAEDIILKINEANFCVSIIRPPMIYGRNCKGNFPKLAKLATISPIFPDIKNSRSMLYIGNLCKALEYIIDEKCDGILFPQNHEYVCTTELVKLIAQANGKKIHTTPLFNRVIRIMAKSIPPINKVFGSLTYDKSLSEIFANVHHLSLEDSINEMYENN